MNSNYVSIDMYPPHCQCPQPINIKDAVEYHKKGWAVDPSARCQKLFKEELERQQKKESKAKKEPSNKTKTKTTKTSPTSTTKKTVVKGKNKAGDDIIRVYKTITIKKK